jgi:hypothetical protein
MYPAPHLTIPLRNPRPPAITTMAEEDEYYRRSTLTRPRLMVWISAVRHRLQHDLHWAPRPWHHVSVDLQEVRGGNGPT